MQQQLKQSSRPVKPGPPTKPKPNVALSRKSSKKYFDTYVALNRFNQTMICDGLGYVWIWDCATTVETEF